MIKLTQEAQENLLKILSKPQTELQKKRCNEAIGTINYPINIQSVDKNNNEKILTQTELDAKKFIAWKLISQNNEDLHFIIVDERENCDVSPDFHVNRDKNSNEITIRASYFDGVERFSRLIPDFNKYVEYATTKCFNASDDDFEQQIIEASKTIKDNCIDVRL